MADAKEVYGGVWLFKVLPKQQPTLSKQESDRKKAEALSKAKKPG